MNERSEFIQVSCGSAEGRTARSAALRSSDVIGGAPTKEVRS
jgi:hypothetical protein